MDLNPMEEQKALLDAKAAQRTNVLVWAGLGKNLNNILFVYLVFFRSDGQ